MFDGNGNWTSEFSAQVDRDNGIKILASRFDNIFIADIKESFENCITKDGQIGFIGDINANGNKVFNVKDGTNTTDAVNKRQLDTKANSSDVVNLTGTQTITGFKTHTANIEMRSTNGTQTPVLRFHIPNVRYTGLVETSDGLVVQDGSGTALDRLYVGASDAVNTAVTTVNKSKATNGYFKLGNGLIIQWGQAASGGATVTLPTPFTSTNYKVAITQGLNSEHNVNPTVSDKTTTKFFAGHHSWPIDWIAIGY